MYGWTTSLQQSTPFPEELVPKMKIGPKTSIEDWEEVPDGQTSTMTLCDTEKRRLQSGLLGTAVDSIVFLCPLDVANFCKILQIADLVGKHYGQPQQSPLGACTI